MSESNMCETNMCETSTSETSTSETSTSETSTSETNMCETSTSSHFLDICAPFQVQQANQASGVLRLGHYCGALSIQPVALLLEGVNQCAVRLGRSVIDGGNTAASRVLPVAIKSFVQHQVIALNDFDFQCVATPFGNTARVEVSLLKQDDQSCIASAEITVALL